MLAGVRPSISWASVPTASIWPLLLLNATMDGSLRTMPRPRAKMQVLAVPEVDGDVSGKRGEQIHWTSFEPRGINRSLDIARVQG